MIKLEDNHLEWALKHLKRYSHSDFYPRIFEFAAISHNWQAVKQYILSLDISEYQPKSPMIRLAPKPNGMFRVSHQLDPIDSLIYTALIREVCESIEAYRIPESENIACSYRIKPDTEGSFFSKNTGWDIFISRTDDLTKKFENGYVLVADITDFYNQIYTHRINALISEAGKGVYDDKASVIENFLLAMNRKTSRGIPVGPTPSIILAELVMASIDRFILDNYTNDFVRYVDDIRIFFHTFEDAITILHKLTLFLYSYHRLVCSGEKTKILDIETFSAQYALDEQKVEQAAIMDQADALAAEKMEEFAASFPPYDAEYIDYDQAYEETLQAILTQDQFSLLSTSYHTLVEQALTTPIDYVLLRHVLRQASRYRIRSIIPLVLDNFYMILPVIREAVIYLNAVINKRVVQENHSRFEQIFSHFYMTLPFVNLWVSYLLQDDSFNEINLPSNYEGIISTRDQALIALRRKDTTWVRSYREQVDLLGSWDRRATLYSTSLLPSSEMLPLAKSIAASGDIIDKSIASFISSKKKT